jgi:hypothetical protein
MALTRLSSSQTRLSSEERARATSESYRERWDAGIRRLKIDRTLARLAQDKADAETRSQERHAKLAAYEKALAAYEALGAELRAVRKRPTSPFERHREVDGKASDWLSSVSLPSP